MGLYIKNIGCNHCKAMLQSELNNLGLHYKDLGSGMAEISEEVPPSLQYQLDNSLKKYGLELVVDNKSLLVNKIKHIINQLITNAEEDNKFVLSSYISDKLNYNYKYLYNLFIAATGTTINWYYITQKIEHVKYLLRYEQVSVSEIAYRLNYSSVAHLSNQFKKIAGLTPTEYKNMQNTRLQHTAKKIPNMALQLA